MKYVTTRTPSQVASHAQKYFLRLVTSNDKKKRRSSVFDMPFQKDDVAATQQYYAETSSQVFDIPFHLIISYCIPSNYYTN